MVRGSQNLGAIDYYERRFETLSDLQHASVFAVFVLSCVERSRRIRRLVLPTECKSEISKPLDEKAKHDYRSEIIHTHTHTHTHTQTGSNNSISSSISTRKQIHYILKLMNFMLQLMNFMLYSVFLNFTKTSLSTKMLCQSQHKNYSDH
jgi:hypothetical protein